MSKLLKFMTATCLLAGGFWLAMAQADASVCFLPDGDCDMDNSQGLADGEHLPGPVPNPECGGYNLSYSETASYDKNCYECESCTSKGVTKYKCQKKIDTGEYTLNASGNCVKNEVCDPKYNLTEKKDANCWDCTPCTSNGVTKYECKEKTNMGDYKIVDGECKNDVCENGSKERTCNADEEQYTVGTTKAGSYCYDCRKKTECTYQYLRIQGDVVNGIEWFNEYDDGCMYKKDESKRIPTYTCDGKTAKACDGPKTVGCAPTFEINTGCYKKCFKYFEKYYKTQSNTTINGYNPYYDGIVANPSVVATTPSPNVVVTNKIKKDTNTCVRDGKTYYEEICEGVTTCGGINKKFVPGSCVSEGYKHYNGLTFLNVRAGEFGSCVCNEDKKYYTDETTCRANSGDYPCYKSGGCYSYCEAHGTYSTLEACDNHKKDSETCVQNGYNCYFPVNHFATVKYVDATTANGVSGGVNIGVNCNNNVQSGAGGLFSSVVNFVAKIKNGYLDWDGATFLSRDGVYVEPGEYAVCYEAWSNSGATVSGVHTWADGLIGLRIDYAIISKNGDLSNAQCYVDSTQQYTEHHGRTCNALEGGDLHLDGGSWEIRCFKYNLGEGKTYYVGTWISTGGGVCSVGNVSPKDNAI